MSDEPVLRLVDLKQSFSQGLRKIRVLENASAEIFAGQTVALVGPSGAGKSTFLHIVGLLEKPNSGSVILSGHDCVELNDAQRTAIRRTQVGFVYQFHQLLPEFSALENVVMPQLIRGRTRKEAKLHAQSLLANLGLGERVDHRPAELSGGEQQRVAIARAIANDPKILLADEPTGNLDPKTAARVFDQLLKIVRETKLAAVMATHNMDLARRMDRILLLEDGKLIEQ